MTSIETPYDTDVSEEGEEVAAGCNQKEDGPWARRRCYSLRNHPRAAQKKEPLPIGERRGEVQNSRGP